MRGISPYQIADITTTAIKGFGVRSLDLAEVEPAGLVGDRDFFLVDELDQLFSATRSGSFIPWWSRWNGDTAVLEIGQASKVVLSEPIRLGTSVEAGFYGVRSVHARVVEGSWSDTMSDIAGRPLRLVKSVEPSGGIDVQPVTMVARASVSNLGTETDGAPLDGRRFRLNLTIDGPAAFDEEGWAGRTATAGTVRFRLGDQVPRCAAVLHRPDDGVIDVNPLSMINARRGVQMGPGGRSLHLGVYATVLQAGQVRTGDTFTLGEHAARGW